MKLQICMFFALIAYACASPIPDEETSPIQSAVSDNTEKKINLIEDDVKSKVQLVPAVEVKDETHAAESTPELKTIVEKKESAEGVKEDAPAERKLDIVAPEVKSLSDVPVVPEVKSIIEPEATAAPEVEKKIESLPEPVAETKEIKEDKPAETEEETMAEKKTDELKSEERQVRGNDKAEEASAPIEEPVVAAIVEAPKQEQVSELRELASPVAFAEKPVDEESAKKLPEVPEMKEKKIDSAESKESEEKKDDSKESSESEEDKSA